VRAARKGATRARGTAKRLIERWPRSPAKACTVDGSRRLSGGSGWEQARSGRLTTTQSNRKPFLGVRVDWGGWSGCVFAMRIEKKRKLGSGLAC